MCTLDEILKDFTEDEKKDYMTFKSMNQKKEFAQYIKNNPKIVFNQNEETFYFKKRF